MRSSRMKTCSNEATGKSAFCSKSCRAQHSRRNNPSATSVPKRNIEGATSEAQHDGPEAPTLKDIPLGPASLADYQDPDGRHYVARINPELLNWGPALGMNELKATGLIGNREPIPGDWDYSGVCEKVDGQWRVKAC